MFEKVLIANRGEIAVRIMRTCHELGIHTVAVYSEADAKSMHVRMADKAICIGPAPASASYLQIPAIISAAEISDVEAIHPGYGLLSENARLAEVCDSCGIQFIGPPASAIEAVGNKVSARKIARETKVMTIPGSVDVIDDDREALKLAKQVGYPVIVKAAAGGGGRGMRIAHNDMSLVQSILAAKAEADAAFGFGGVYIEKYIPDARHVEMQILCDKHGGAVHLMERDCSVQRRYQKLVEESPSPAVDEKLRRLLGDAAIRIAKHVGYQNAGTVEFLLAPDKKFYFMEVNSRLQVEHPVTEEVLRMDLVREQLRVASGEKLGYAQDGVKPMGWAIECRINAEDPSRNFMPCPGVIRHYEPPGGFGVRVDTHIYSGYEIPQYYDSLLAKVIARGATRAEAIARMTRALDEIRVEGVPTTIGFLKRIMAHRTFRDGKHSTQFVQHLMAEESAL